MAENNSQLSLRRINMDSFWLIKYNGINIALDPWLLGAEVDYAYFFNQQRLVTDALSIKEFGCVIHCIIISFPFSDHCNEETLLLFDKTIPIFAVKAAKNRLQNNASLKDRTYFEIPVDLEFVHFHHIMFSSLLSQYTLDYVHNGLLIRSTKSNGGFFYAPHGFLTEDDSEIVSQLEAFQLDILISSSSLYSLPWFLGGEINLGLKKLISLVDKIKPRYVFETHSEQKLASGIIPWLAKTEYPSVNDIKDRLSNYIDISNYSEFVIY